MDLLTYLQENEPYELVKSKYGRDEYRTKTNGSLVISNGLWRWNRGQVGGRSALDFLIKVRGMGFTDAVTTILDARGIDYSYQDDKGVGVKKAIARSESETKSSLPQPPLPNPQPKPELILPEATRFPTNVVSYLQKRGISPEVISRCFELGILFESRKYQNVVFVGKDEHGKARFACVRGISDDFKGDVAGSDKQYSFSLPIKNPKCPQLLVFESPIDLLSHVTLQQRGSLDDGRKWASADAHRLSLAGTSDVALIAYLERNPTIEQIYLCLDADEAGQTATRKIATTLANDNRFEHIDIFSRPPLGDAKDYNEVLLHVITAEREQKQPNHHHESTL